MLPGMSSAARRYAAASSGAGFCCHAFACATFSAAMPLFGSAAAAAAKYFSAFAQ